MAKLGTIIADFRTALAAKMAVGATTGTLQSATDDDGVALPAGRYFFTIDGDNSQKEHISCELSGTALTSVKSVSRQGVETSGTVREHRVGASVVITNFAHIRYLNDMVGGDLIWDSPDLTGVNSITGTGSGGLDDFTYLDGLDTPTAGETTKAANVAYVNSVAIAGAPDASISVKGIVKLSSAPASATEPIACGTNDPRLPSTDEKAAIAGQSGTAVSASNKLIDAASATATPTASKIPIASSTGMLDRDWVMLDFGNGIDGDVTISTNTTLAADKYYSNLTVNSGVTLNTGGYKIFVSGTLTNNGIISRNGVDGGAGQTNGTGGIAGAALADHTVKGSVIGVVGGAGQAGGAGTVGNVGTAANPSLPNVAGVAGGTGGGTGGRLGGAGGAGGAATSETASFTNIEGTYSSVTLNTENLNKLFTLPVLSGSSSGATLSTCPSGGSGGGGAGADGSQGAGGGGSASGGGVVYVAARIIINNGTIESNGGVGGKGGDATAGNAGGGGGGAGGNGGLVVLIYKTLSVAGTVNVSGGTGGAAGANFGTYTGSTAGTNGAAGKYIKIKL